MLAGMRKAGFVGRRHACLLYCQETTSGACGEPLRVFALHVQVCLSLLGTWHGTDASQKWDPQNSSLFQILLSIQGMILISDPYFNEPNVERMRGQTEGTKASNSYNAEIHLNNIRSVI